MAASSFRPARTTAHVIKGATLGELTRAIAARLARYEKATGGLKLAPEFEKTLAATIQRFNGFASGGRDFDFHRGERQVELLFNGSVAPSPSAPNPTMYPDLGAGAVLRGAAHRRQSRHQGRSED